MCQLLIRNGVPKSHTCTSIMPFSLSPYSFYSFVMSDIKLMVSFGFTINHVSLKSSLISPSVDQNMCNRCTKEISLWPHVPYDSYTLYCSALYCYFRKQLLIRYKTLIQKNWFHQQGSLSLHHHHSILYVQEEYFFNRQSGEYQSGLITHEATFLLLINSLWMLSLWISGQAWHALPYHTTIFSYDCRQTLQSS